ncbi:class I SAM-dependent methyltransferase [Nocardia sienata]|uniref:class I SAM-dependent methyltransferase n=1 Tax=Nocardia sienata TaxID=248552 RepID=UPI000A4EB1B1|nr:class I SAM-dependent methyltransferase [Nocardia sienata]
MKTPIAGRLWDVIGTQLGRPDGMIGRLVGRILNRGNRATVAAAVAAADPAHGATVVDIGFGGGVGLGLLLDRVGATGTVHGVEVSPTMIDQARRHYRNEIANNRLQLHNAAMHDLPLTSATVDAVISTNTVYFIEDLTTAFTEVARVLRPSGRLVLGVGDPTAMARMPFTENRFRLRPIAEVTGHLAAAGLTVVGEERLTDEGAVEFHVLTCKKKESYPPSAAPGA